MLVKFKKICLPSIPSGTVRVEYAIIVFVSKQFDTDFIIIKSSASKTQRISGCTCKLINHHYSLRLLQKIRCQTASRYMKVLKRNRH